MSSTAFDDQFTVGTQTIVLHQAYDTMAILRRNVATLELALRTQTERAESYAETLRSIASYVGAGGYNADTVDAGVFEQKIRWGIGQIIERLEKTEAELARLLEQKPAAWRYQDAKGNYRYRGYVPGFDVEYWILKPVALYAAPVPAPAVLAVPDGDDFNGSTPHLIQCMEALVRLDADGVLVPHGIGRDASKLLSAAANRLRQQAASSVPEEWRETLSKLVGIVESSTKFHGCDDVTKQARALLQSSEVTDNAAADRLLEGGE